METVPMAKDHKLKIYLDNCCYNRPYDDLLIERNRLESEAVMSIIKLAQGGFLDIIGSEAIEFEMENLSNLEKLDNVRELYGITGKRVEYDDGIFVRAMEIRKRNKYIRPLDSLHLASAEKAEADLLLTTDDKFMNNAQLLELTVRVTNPLLFMAEVKYE
jgi:predicted nucleic acid-binding protein